MRTAYISFARGESTPFRFNVNRIANFVNSTTMCMKSVPPGKTTILFFNSPKFNLCFALSLIRNSNDEFLQEFVMTSITKMKHGRFCTEEKDASMVKCMHTGKLLQPPYYTVANRISF